MRLRFHVWRQAGPESQGSFVPYDLDDIEPKMSLLETLDVLNDRLVLEGKSPIAFESDCREGICGACSLVINGQPHGPEAATTTCQLYMRHFRDGDEIHIEPWRSRSFPVIRDLVVDRSALDRIIQAGGYISARAGPKPDPNAVPIEAERAEAALDVAACIGCGACVAACPNGAAMLFTAAKVVHLGLLPQGQVERSRRVQGMVSQMEREGFGSCRNYRECEAICPKEIGIDAIGWLNRELRHSVRGVLRSEGANAARPRSRD
jgi:succinate dehydrogenase / fumarate reductase iron-sulfur subunit